MLIRLRAPKREVGLICRERSSEACRDPIAQKASAGRCRLSRHFLKMDGCTGRHLRGRSAWAVGGTVSELGDEKAMGRCEDALSFYFERDRLSHQHRNVVR